MADRNPSPPPDITDEIQHADTIGDTVYSKNWLFALLVKVIQKVDQKSDNGQTSAGSTPLRPPDSNTPFTLRPASFCPTPQYPSDSPSVTPRPSPFTTPRLDSHGDTPLTGRDTAGLLDLDDDLEEDMCRLWDITVNREVLKYLGEFGITRIFSTVIMTSKYPRLTEICIGILANMACGNDLCIEITQQEGLMPLMMRILSCRDTPTLVETIRFLHTVVSNENVKEVWLKTIKESPDAFENILFILSSSTNSSLLMNCVQLIEVVVRQEDSLAESWCHSALLEALLEAQRQMEWLHGSQVEVFHRLLYVFSSTENGVGALITSFSSIFPTLAIYLKKVCEDEPQCLPLERYANSMRAIVPVLDVIICNVQSQTALQLIQSNGDVIKYLLLILLSCEINSQEYSCADAIHSDLSLFFKDFINATYKYLEEEDSDPSSVVWLRSVDHDFKSSRENRSLRAQSLLVALQPSEDTLDPSPTQLQLDSLCRRLHLSHLHQGLLSFMPSRRPS